jgi:DNA recombination protein RmuC
MDFLTVAIFLLATSLGFVAGWYVQKSRQKAQTPDSSENKIELQLEKERSARLSVDIQSLNEQLKGERQLVMDLNTQLATLKANHANILERLNEQKGEFSVLQEKFSAEFRNLANQIFEEKSKKFTDQNKSNLTDLLKPLGEKLTEFERKVEQTNKESIERTSSLKEQLFILRDLNQKMTQEAENLTKALKGDVKMQGNWGEVVLESILEKSGLEKGREYYTQETHHNEAGRRLRPDVIVRLPENKNLIIDAKASLVAYERYMSTDDPAEKDRFLKDHLLSVRMHIKGLADKNYHQLFDGGNLDYVLMFVPIESAFALIVQHGGELYNEAHEKSIIIVSPSTLIATLRTVASIWKHEYQNRNALEIARQGGALYDKFAAFVGDLVDVGKSLDKSKEVYREAMTKLVDGRDNLIRKTERLKELGAKTTKSMDEKLLHRAGVDDDKQELPEPPRNLFE